MGKLTWATSVLAVAATGGALALAGVAPAPPNAAPSGGGRTSRPGDRLLACPGGPGGKTFAGLLPHATGGTVTATSGARRPARVKVVSGGTTTVGTAKSADPLTLTGTGGAAAGLFATRTANGSAAATICQAARASWWFAGAGASPLHATTLVLQNPRAGSAVADVTAYGPHGVVAAPGLRGITVPPYGERRVSLPQVAPSAGRVSLHVQTTRGLVTASAYDTARGVLAGDSVSHWLPNSSGPSTHVLLTGLPDVVHQGTLTLTNTSAQSLVAHVRLSTANGAFAPTKVKPATVPPHGTVQVALGAALTGSAAKGAAVVVDAPAPVLASLSVQAHGAPLAAVSAHPFAGTAGVAVPQGTRAQVVLSAGTTPSHATLTFLGATGHPIRSSQETVRPGTTIRVPAPRGTASVVVAPRKPGLVSGSVLLNGPSGSVALPLVAAAVDVVVPRVSPAH